MTFESKWNCFVREAHQSHAHVLTYIFNQPTQSSNNSRLSRASCHHINCILRVQDVLTSPGDSITAVVQPNNQHVNLSAVKQLCKKTIAVHLFARNVILLTWQNILLLSDYEYFMTWQNISSKNLTKNMSLRHFPNKTWKAYSKFIISRTPASPGTSAGFPQKQLPCVRIWGSMSWYHDAANAMDLSMVFCWVWCIGIGKIREYHAINTYSGDDLSTITI